jgi:23S rRNA (cytosine1962-C5)-methyltransferase
MTTIKLKKREERRIRRGHPWVFANEIDANLKSFEPGERVQVTDHSGRPIGEGYINPHSLIAVRMLTRGRENFSLGTLRKRITEAYALRRRFYPGRHSYRAIYSESDLLPGLIVDKYDGWLAVQVTTAGMEAMLPDVIDALKAVFKPSGIALRNDSPIRKLEGLELYTDVPRGTLTGPVEFSIGDMKLSADLQEGQKTGFFFDQADNYSLLDNIARGARMLDLFSHAAPWSVYGLMHGAEGSVAVDASDSALDTARRNFELNGLSDKAKTVRSDAFEYFNSVSEPFDIVVCDPPAFVKNRAKVAEGLKGYRDINARAMKALSPGGYLISCSCSRHVDYEKFMETLRVAASGAGRTVRVLERRGQSKDHPVLLAAPETEYLKCVLMKVD